MRRLGCELPILSFVAACAHADGAELEIRVVSTKATCRSCGHSFELEDYLWLCTECGDRQLEITEGRELMVESIEVD